MVLVTPEFFSREVFGPPDGGSQGRFHKGVCRHHSVLLLSACDVDSVCCCQMLQKNAWARSHFNDRQVAGRDVAVDLVFVRSESLFLLPVLTLLLWKCSYTGRCCFCRCCCCCCLYCCWRHFQIVSNQSKLRNYPPPQNLTVCPAKISLVLARCSCGRTSWPSVCVS